MAQLFPSIPPQLKAQIKEMFDQFSEFHRMENRRRSAKRKKQRQQKRQGSVEGETGPAGRAGGGDGRESISSPAVERKEECISETVKDYSCKPYEPRLSATTASTNTFTTHHLYLHPMLYLTLAPRVTSSY